MEIRKDFEPVEMFLHRLLKIAEAFAANNLKNWPHLKNGEDFKYVYALPFATKNPIEEIYATGRDCAVSMASKLRDFNYADEYPTLSSYIDSFDKGWVYQESELFEVYTKGKAAADTLDHCPWAVGQMLELYQDQAKLLAAVKATLKIIQQSHLYKLEKGEVPMEKNSGITIGIIHGKVNIHSTDNSTNTYSQSNPIFIQLQDAISKSTIPQIEREQLIRNIGEMSETHGKPSFMEKYKDFIQNAANHMSVVSPFIPALSGLLS